MQFLAVGTVSYLRCQTKAEWKQQILGFLQMQEDFCNQLSNLNVILKWEKFIKED